MVKTKTQPAKKRLSALRCAFFMPLPAFVPGTIMLHVQAIGMEPALHLMLAARRVEDHHQRAQRFRLLAFQGGAQRQRRACRVAQDHAKGIEPYDEPGPLLDRHTHALALGIAAVCQDHIPWSQGEMFECFTRVDIADQYSENCKDTKSIAIWRR